MPPVGNLVTSDRVAGSVPLQMSNGLTSVLFEVLSIAGSDLAVSPWEKKLVYWLVCHDQERAGLGCVGFDVIEMGFSREGFYDEKRFVLSLVDAARRRHGWERLSYPPREESAFDALRHLGKLVDDLPIFALDPPLDADAWIPNELPDATCEVHGVYLHEAGCIVCNGAPIDAPPEHTPNRSLR